MARMDHLSSCTRRNWGNEMQAEKLLTTYWKDSNGDSKGSREGQLLGFRSPARNANRSLSCQQLQERVKWMRMKQMGKTPTDAEIMGTGAELN